MLGRGLRRETPTAAKVETRFRGVLERFQPPRLSLPGGGAWVALQKAS